MKQTLIASAAILVLTGAAHARTEQQQNEYVTTALFSTTMAYAMTKHDGIACGDPTLLEAANTILRGAASVMVEGGYAVGVVALHFHNAFVQHHDLAGERCIEGARERALKRLELLPGRLDNVRKAMRGESW